MKKIYLLLLCFLVFISCGPSSRMKSAVNMPELPADYEIFVLESFHPVPSWATYIGELQVGDTGFSTDCNYYTVVATAQNTARAMGGNIVKITKHKKPDLWSTCHRIRADVYFVPDYEGVIPQPVFTFDQDLAGENCAIIYFYREKSFAGSAVRYDVSLNDEVVWRASNNSGEWIKVTAVGPAVISARTESAARLEIDITPGRHYYIRCGVATGVMVGRPVLEIVDEGVGSREFNEITNK